MTLKRKLLFNFLLVGGIVLLCSLFGIWSIRKINANLDYVTAGAWRAANAAMETSIDNLTRIVAQDEYLKGDKDRSRALIRRAEERFSEKFLQLHETGLADGVLLANIKELWNKLTDLESKTLANFHLKTRTKLQLDENAVYWTKTLEQIRYRLQQAKGDSPEKAQEAENVLVSIGLLSLGERASLNNYLAGSLGDNEVVDLIEGFRSNLRRRIVQLSDNPVVKPEDAKAIDSIYTESEVLTEKLLRSHQDYLKNQSELSFNTLRLVEAFETIKESMNKNMEQAALLGREVSQSSQQYFGIFAVLAFFVAILIGITITGKITRPIRGLTRATEALAGGALDHRVQVQGSDEIGQLGKSFNKMADDILRYTEEIRQKSLQAELANQEFQVTNKELYQALNELEKQSAMLKDTNRELETATRLKSEFLANMSHELRTPMNSIIGFTNLVMRKSSDKLEPRQRENLQKVLISAEHLLALINSILDLSKIESGKMDVHVQTFPITEVVDNVKEVLSPMVNERRLAFRSSIADEIPVMHSDPEKIKQILLNLLSNAVKFTEAGEVSLAIQRKSVTLNGRPSTDCLEILVKDTGIGIPKKAREIIFEDFRQADGSTTRRYGGTGLGLTICKKLCELLGGKVAVTESTVGKGSTFRVVLPLDYEIEAHLAAGDRDTGTS